jgi:hypothetical protein
MAYGNEGGENVKFKQKKKKTCKKILRYVYVDIMFFHFKYHS